MPVTIQQRFRSGEIVVLHEFFKIRPGLAGKQGTQSGAVGLDEFHRGGVEVGE